MQLGPNQLALAQIGVPVEEYYEMLNGVTWTALLASPLVLLLASAGGYWMSRRALEPVDQITRTAAEIGAYNLSQRLPLRKTGDELDRLSATLNPMFARLEAAFRQITQFTADASHELRTPVAIIRTTAELARSKPRSPEEYRKALDGILTESERTSRLIEDLMLLARADADVVSAREPQVPARLDDPHAGPSSRRVGAAVCRRVVDDDDFVRAGRRRVVQRLQAAREIVARVERNDDDREVEGHRGNATTSSVSRAARRQS